MGFVKFLQYNNFYNFLRVLLFLGTSGWEGGISHSDSVAVELSQIVGLHWGLCWFSWGLCWFSWGLCWFSWGLCRFSWGLCSSCWRLCRPCWRKVFLTSIYPSWMMDRSSCWFCFKKLSNSFPLPKTMEVPAVKEQGWNKTHRSNQNDLILDTSVV